MLIKNDCFFFEGDHPCNPHKDFGYHCDNCQSYKPIKEKILIIKLGAIGDLIRTTPILRKLRNDHPYAYITWLTYTPEVLSKKWIDKILPVNIESIELIKQLEFDWIINLDKEALAISLTKQIKSKKKSGFTLDDFGKVKPISKKAENQKWITGLFNDISKENKKHYIQEIFEIVGYKFDGEEYILSAEKEYQWSLNKSKLIIGLNTGCGERWKSRLWPDEYWIELASYLIQSGYEVIFLGGEQEHHRNKMLAEKSNGKYFGYFNLKKFISLVDECNIIITAVTMAMHIAIGLKKKTVIFNNIFNKNEFFLYGRGKILEPNPKCDCYYIQNCPHDSMKNLTPISVLEVIKELI